MATLIVPYKDINQVLKGIRTQVIDSIDYCQKNMPSYNSPENMFYGLKNMTTYINDPKGVELLQSVQTLFDNNIHGISGAGDCDCFTILVLSMCYVNNFVPQEIVLAGRNKQAPAHIYSRIFYNGSWKNLDLTQPLYNTERNYKFNQYIKI